MAVLSISRQFGAGGRTLGEMVASELGYHFLHESQLDQMAAQADQANGQEATQSQYHTQVVELLTSLAPSNFMDRWTGAQGEDKALIESLSRVIQELSEAGKVVLLGRGAQFILRYRPDTVRVLLVSELEQRVNFMVQHYDMDQATARKLIAEADKKRARFLNNFYPGEPDESSLYHLVLNTSLLSISGATNLVVRLVRRIEEKLKQHAYA
ncbi:MAG: cytidylate kinase-like family protein [Desulfarculaceae bacterium]|nr:cytidylate kinase-like family protein [Desulfarculaceae bacterium]MCF8072998.1 cytidylate kinase-like family protein [Desulfarculaceae bacterium]MCF8100706.1 cytidylate kinase-like family protein [Desulfarculaceae bacterium]MCF8115444.1 cytidylate kinase-like family protein [Desulfarculaceae bacterium]